MTYPHARSCNALNQIIFSTESLCSANLLAANQISLIFISIFGKIRSLIISRLYTQSMFFSYLNAHIEIFQGGSTVQRPLQTESVRSASAWATLSVTLEKRAPKQWAYIAGTQIERVRLRVLFECSLYKPCINPLF